MSRPLRGLVCAAVLGFAVSALSAGEVVPACHCNGGSAAAYGMSQPLMMPGAGYYAPQGYAPQGAWQAPYSGGVAIPPQPKGPPPGTLGRTYQLPSKPISAEKHPRVAMLQVRIKGATEVYVTELNEFRSEDYVDGYQSDVDPSLWVFETQPLYPDIPNVYRIEARADDTLLGVQYVRLIRGRMISVAFQ